MPVLSLPAAPEFLSNYLLFNAHLISAAPRDDLHWGGVPVIVYFAIATTCPCLARKSPKKCKIEYLVPLFFSLFLSRTLSSTFILSHSVSSNKKRWGNKF